MFFRPSRPFIIYLAILSLAGGIAVYLATSRQGPGVSTDAAMLLSTAENIARGHGLMDYRGLVLTQFPPLYSLILAFGSLLFRQDVFTVGWALNVLVFAAIIWFSGLYFYDAFKEHRLLAYFASFILFASASLIQISANIASDPLFLLMVLFFLTSMSAYLKSKKISYLVLAGALTIVACFERYAGLALVIAGALVLVCASLRDVRRGMLLAFLFAVLSGVPIVLWGTLHNAPYNGTVFGARLPSLPGPNFITGVEKILYWFIPLHIISAVGPLLLLGLVLCAIAVVMLASNPRLVLQKLLSPEVLPSLIFLVVYSAVLVFDISYYELKGINTDRVHIIVLPALLIVIFTLVLRLLDAAEAKFGRVPVYGLCAVLFLAWSIYPISKANDYIERSMRSGDVSSYNSINKVGIRTSPLARYLQGLDVRGMQVYSNGGDSAWFILHTQIDPTPMIPSDDRLAYLKQQYAGWPGRGAVGYLIWFNREAHKENYASPQELSTIASLELLYQDDDAAVYRVSPR